MKPTNVIINKLSFLNDLIVQYNIDVNTIKVKNNKQFLHLFASLKDFRIPKKCTYPIETLLIIIFFAKLNEEGESCTSIARYAKIQAEYLYNYGIIAKDKNGNFMVPSHDCFRYFLMNFDSNELKKIFISRLEKFLDNVYDLNSNPGIYTLYNVDGQEFRGTGRSKNSDSNMANFSTLNIFDASTYVCIYSRGISGKGHEVPVARGILKYLNLRKKIITADALHTNVETSKIIIQKKGNYVFRVKGNQEGIQKEIDYRFSLPKASIEKVETSERLFEFLKLSKNYKGIDLEAPSTYIKVTSKMSHNKGEILCFVSSLKDNVAIQEAIENRWEIENGLHKAKDYYLNEDEFRLKDKTAVENFAVINNIMVAFYQIAKATFNEKELITVKKRMKLNSIETLKLLVSLISSNQLIKMIKEKMA